MVLRRNVVLLRRNVVLFVRILVRIKYGGIEVVENPKCQNVKL